MFFVINFKLKNKFLQKIRNFSDVLYREDFFPFNPPIRRRKKELME